MIAPVSAAGRTGWLPSTPQSALPLPSASTSPARGALPGGMAQTFVSERSGAVLPELGFCRFP